jgi:hypothetical protein
MDTDSTIDVLFIPLVPQDDPGDCWIDDDFLLSSSF